MTEKKLFVNQDTPSIIDTEYRNCNFGHTEAIEDAGRWKGHRLFPGDDTPRTFISCNLINCEPPPGSMVIGGNNAILQPKVFDYAENGIVIDGQPIVINHYKRIVYGKWTSQGYQYFLIPKEYLFEEEA